MRLPPPSVLATFPKGDWDHPKLLGPGLVIVNVIFMALATAAVSLRVYARACVKRQFGKDDAFIVVALVFALGLGLNTIIANQVYGWDRHIWDLPFSMYTPSLQIAMSGRVLFSLAATFTRISLILFYYRLIQDAQLKWYPYVLHGSMLWTIGVGVTFVFLSIFMCLPIRAYWAFPPLEVQRCLNEGATTLLSGLINSFSDIWVTLLPVPLIMQLHLPIKQRFAVLVLLCLGIVVTAAGVARTYYIWKSLISSWDLSFYAYYLWIAACIEIDMAVICACAPALKPLFSSLVTRLFTSLSSLASSRRSRSGGDGATRLAPSTSFISKENLWSDPSKKDNNNNNVNNNHPWRPSKPMRRSKGPLLFLTGLSTLRSRPGGDEEDLSSWTGIHSTVTTDRTNTATTTLRGDEEIERTRSFDVVSETLKKDQKAVRVSVATCGGAV